MDLFFGFSGRIGRGRWWLGQLAIIGTWITVLLVLGAIVSLSGTVDAAQENGWGSSVLMVLATAVLTTWINLATTIKRYHDRGKSGVWFCVILIPLIGPVWQLVECGLLEGDRGGNNYGPPPGGGGTRGFDTEVEAHIARMKAEHAPMREIKAERFPAATPARTSASVPQMPPARRPAAPSGFGRRTV